ncbi:MAG: hypothetical protein AAFX10_16715, partial [Pseudomonadota bacterium]
HCAQHNAFDCVVCVTGKFADEQDTVLPSTEHCVEVDHATASLPTTVLPAAIAGIRTAWPPSTGPPAGS